jgi:pyrroline-5-carboxylate reductase
MTGSPGTRIALIGGGNMGRGLIGGLLARGFSATDITVADPDTAGLADLASRFGVRTTTSNVEAIAAADVVVLAVKPQQMAAVATALAPGLQQSRPLVLSVAAGIRAADLARWTGPDVAIVRTMPNRPALIGAGASGLYAAPGVSAGQRQLAESVMGATGLCLWVAEEAQIDAITALSGSGPAYFFLLAELMARAGEAQGLPPDVARRLAAQTLAGAGQLVAAETDPDLARMRAEVTSKGGTTAAALGVFEAGHLGRLVADAMAAAAQRSHELAEQFGR